LDTGLANPLTALFLLGLLYLAFQFGLLEQLGHQLMAPPAPTGPTNVGEIYKQEMETRRAAAERQGA
jgi:hypothetical protein